MAGRRKPSRPDVLGHALTRTRSQSAPKDTMVTQNTPGRKRMPRKQVKQRSISTLVPSPEVESLTSCAAVDSNSTEKLNSPAETTLTSSIPPDSTETNPKSVPTNPVSNTSAEKMQTDQLASTREPPASKPRTAEATKSAVATTFPANTQQNVAHPPNSTGHHDHGSAPTTAQVLAAQELIVQLMTIGQLMQMQADWSRFCTTGSPSVAAAASGAASPKVKQEEVKGTADVQPLLRKIKTEKAEGTETPTPGNKPKRGPPSSAKRTSEQAELLNLTPPAKKQSTKSSKIARASNEPGKPKRPANSWVLFVRDMIPVVREKNPGLPTPEYNKILAKMWKSMSATEKKKYEKMQAESSRQYKHDMAAYEASQIPPFTIGDTPPEQGYYALLNTDIDDYLYGLDAFDSPPYFLSVWRGTEPPISQIPIRRAQSYDEVAKVLSLTKSPSVRVLMKREEERRVVGERELPDVDLSDSDGIYSLEGPLVPEGW
ncbi:hypothetical protein HK097_011171 [Rhizophlyctis rosea]|uniref:HMG box domain-containing protein n=1 Tax=Rhizophlyctis rosea TaxID=64517 RepID=A0AAD5XA74_9FUNG|nr:hypothetical protein HK097_011171 [Rhizophlyctis rosea]